MHIHTYTYVIHMVYIHTYTYRHILFIWYTYIHTLWIHTYSHYSYNIHTYIPHTCMNVWCTHVSMHVSTHAYIWCMYAYMPCIHTLYIHNPIPCPFWSIIDMVTIVLSFCLLCLGVAMEFDSPKKLIEQKTSLFALLVAEYWAQSGRNSANKQQWSLCHIFFQSTELVNKLEVPISYPYVFLFILNNGINLEKKTFFSFGQHSRKKKSPLTSFQRCHDMVLSLRKMLYNFTMKLTCKNCLPFWSMKCHSRGQKQCVSSKGNIMWYFWATPYHVTRMYVCVLNNITIT